MAKAYNLLGRIMACGIQLISLSLQCFLCALPPEVAEAGHWTSVFARNNDEIARGVDLVFVERCCLQTHLCNGAVEMEPLYS